jgi:biotin transport system ATP-binding protein
MIRLDRVTHQFPGRPTAAVDHVDLTIAEQRVGVIGANGSGKSTFARMLNGLVLPTSGRVTVNGLDTAREGKQVRRQVGFCFTNPEAQIVMPTVAEDVAFSLRRSGLSSQAVVERVDDSLERFGLAGLRDAAAHTLSGGQKQLLALAAILVMEPSVLVCDEPTTLLDLRHQREVHGILTQLPQQLVLVTHHLDLVADLDRVIVFDGGRVVADGAPAEAVRHYEGLMR